VVVPGDVAVYAGQHIGEPHRPLIGEQHERVDAAQRDVDEDAQRAQAQPHRGEQIRSGVHSDDLSDSRHQGDGRNARRQRRVRRAGAVGTGGDRAGDGLRVNVAEVRYGQAALGK
jgi:hypothetical protein